MPSETLSPSLTFSSCTTPPMGDGTSIVALSDSSVISACSAFTVSPGFTNTSITGTSLKSPMSGTFTSATPPGADVGAGGGETLGAAGAAAGCAAPSASSVRMRVPSLTLSPTLTFSSFTTPPPGDGTSIVALSDSRVISASSGLTLSPGFTITSMMGMSLKSPMSGTFTSVIAPMILPRLLRFGSRDG